MEQDFSTIRYLFEVNSEMTHHLLLFTDLTALELPRDVPSVVETISRWHNFAVVPEMITTREDGDSINHLSLAFEIRATIKIALTSVRSLDRKYLLET